MWLIVIFVLWRWICQISTLLSNHEANYTICAFAPSSCKHRTGVVYLLCSRFFSYAVVFMIPTIYCMPSPNPVTFHKGHIFIDIYTRPPSVSISELFAISVSVSFFVFISVYDSVVVSMPVSRNIRSINCQCLSVHTIVGLHLFHIIMVIIHIPQKISQRWKICYSKIKYAHIDLYESKLKVSNV